MEMFNVIIVGGGAAGFNAAKTVRTLYPERRVLLVNNGEDLQISCPTPYVVGGKISIGKNIYPLSKVKELGVNLLVSKVTSVSPVGAQIFLEDGSHYSYERLILATGWIPRRLNVEGSTLDGIYYISNRTIYVKKLIQKVREANKIVFIGGGFISIEFADQISKSYSDKEITIIEATHHLASGVFSEGFETEIEEKLRSQNVKILKNTEVIGFDGNGSIQRVILEGGDKVDADVVFAFIGFKPNSKLAVDSGLSTSPRGEIIVDEFLRTSEDNILAAGNCIRHRSAIDGEPVSGMVASVSARDGRLAGINVIGPEAKDRGIVPAGILEVGGTYFGFAGYTERLLKKRNVNFVSSEVDSVDAYPSAFTGCKPLKVKLYFSKSGSLLGAEVEGRSKYVASLIDFISRLIADKLNVLQIATLQTVAFPPITPSPLLQPVQMAALSVRREL